MKLIINKKRETITTDYKSSKETLSYSLITPENEDITVSLNVPKDFFDTELNVGDTFELKQIEKQSKLEE